MDAKLIERITEYLSKGGLFNPELMPPHLTRELLRDCREALSEANDRAEKAERERDEAICLMSEYARQAGEAEGKLAASEMAGTVEGWQAQVSDLKAKVERLEEYVDAAESLRRVGLLNATEQQIDRRDRARAALSETRA